MKKILKNFTNVFRKYKNPLIPLRWRFMVGDNIRCLRNEAYYKVFQTKNPLVGMACIAFAFGPIPQLVHNHLKDDLIQLAGHFTLDCISDKAFENIKSETVKNFKEIKSIETFERKELKIVFNDDREIKIKRFSDVVPKFFELFPEMVTMERYGKCHEMSIKFAISCQNDNVSVATGKIYGFSKSCPFLHSWIEYSSNEEVYCFDYTNNIAMKKEDYYYLFSAKPMEKISSNQLKEDLKLFDKFRRHEKSVANSEVWSKFYLSSREECIKYAQRQNQRFAKKDAKKKEQNFPFYIQKV